MDTLEHGRALRVDRAAPQDSADWLGAKLNALSAAPYSVVNEPRVRVRLGLEHHATQKREGAWFFSNEQCSKQGAPDGKHARTSRLHPSGGPWACWAEGSAPPAQEWVQL